MADYALTKNPISSAKPTGTATHTGCGGLLEPVGTEGKLLCPECAEVGFPLKSPKD